MVGLPDGSLAQAKDFPFLQEKYNEHRAAIFRSLYAATGSTRVAVETISDFPIINGNVLEDKYKITEFFILVI